MKLVFFKDRKLWGIFFLSMGTLLYEVVLTSIFSYIVWSNYAFLIVSTALFGFGIAGVFLYLFQKLTFLEGINRRLSLLAFLFALSAIVSLQIIKIVPLDVSRFNLLVNWVYLIIIFLTILTPFFFSGLAISILLSSNKKSVNRLYFFDLVGASIGSIVLIILITPLGASGTLLLASTMGILSSLIFLKGKSVRIRQGSLVLFLACIIALIPVSEKIFPIYPHQNMRNFIKLLKTQKHFFSGWSTLSKIDVLGKQKNGAIYGQIWINGGQNQSFLAIVGPEGIAGRRPDWGESINFPYYFLSDRKPKVLVIGSSGGTEVVYALSHHSNDVDAVEMDPLICKVVKEKFKKNNRSLFFRPDVHLINDEGRSFVLSTDKKYDLIQMKNNFTPIAIASGSINLSETYLLTVEGFKDYINHLRPDGILALNRWGSVRLCTTLRKAFEELGRKNVWKNVVILTGEAWMLNGFYYKNTPFSQKEIKLTKEYAKARHFHVLYDPCMKKDANLYSMILKGDAPEHLYKFAGFDLSPPTDNRPFFNHFITMGTNIDTHNKLMPLELKYINQLFSWRPWKGSNMVISKADLPALSLAVESLIVSAFFIFLPLFIGRRKEKENYAKWPFLYYFSIIGLGFIMIELCLMKQFILFLGYPAISISLIIASLLFFTGIGSFIAEKFRKRLVPSLRIIFATIFLLDLLLMFSLPWIFSIFLGSAFWIKVAVTIITLIPLGISMGMPFPLGLVLVHERSKNLVGWVWGINGFATVIGSVLTVIISLYYGFDKVFMIASLLYLSGALIVGKMAKKS